MTMTPKPNVARPPVRELPPEVARKIAAGEVIDRPAAVVRELLDNAIDSSADSITVEIEEGGIASVRVSDNGSGMTRDDLAICARPHTTSKIRCEDDLLALSTLGFRGEALASIAAVSKLTITTTRDGREAWELCEGAIKPSRLARGTVVHSRDLFGNFPARRKFLKRQSAETSMCRQIFMEKALAWPSVSFRLVTDGQNRMILPATERQLERVIAAASPQEPDSFFYEQRGNGQGFAFTLILGSPEARRSDRKDLMVFVNGRRINEYSLVQAIEYGSEGHFPNGGHPFAFLFVSIDPSLVDFNIHPAKREVRFRDAGELHKAVSSTTREFYRRYEVARIASSASGDLTLTQLFGGASSLPENAPLADEALPRYHATSALYDQAGFAQTAFARATFARAALAPSATDNPSERGEPSPAEPSGPFRILGQTLGTFIAVERGGSLYLIDQHAAHERILYDELCERKGHRQELMVPYRVETDTEEENAALRERASELSAAGFSLEEEGTGTWLVTAVPERWKGTEDDLREGLVSARSGPEALLSRLFALAACRAAVKDGDVIDADAARRIVSKAFELREPVCPHGRPVWIRLSREDLYRAIKRT